MSWGRYYTSPKKDEEPSKTNDVALQAIWRDLKDIKISAESIITRITSPTCGLERKYLHRSQDSNPGTLKSCTPLLLSVFAGRQDVVRLLLANYKINVRAVNTDKCTALHLAVCSKNLSMLKFLVETGKFDLDAVDCRSQTPLQLAIKNEEDSSEIIDYLIGNFGVPPSLLPFCVAKKKFCG